MEVGAIVITVGTGVTRGRGPDVGSAGCVVVGSSTALQPVIQTPNRTIIGIAMEKKSGDLYRKRRYIADWINVEVYCEEHHSIDLVWLLMMGMCSHRSA